MSILSSLISVLEPTTAAMLSLSLAIALGLLLGRIRFRGVRLGVSGVLFSSLALAQAGVKFEPEATPFIRDFSLVLFVYAIGLSVGPGFFTSLRAEGLRLNTLAAVALLLAGVITAVLTRVMPALSNAGTGVYAGALNSTPALGGGQVVIRQVLESDPARRSASLASSGLAYAVTYPFGVIGPVVLIALLRRLFGVNMDKERTDLAARLPAPSPPTLVADIEVAAGQYVGRPIRELPADLRRGIVFSRLYRAGKQTVPRAATVLQVGDVIRAIGATESVHAVIAILGRPSPIDLSRVAGELQRTEMIVTRATALRRTLRDLGLRARTGVTLAQVTRAGIEFVPHGDFVLKFGDHVTAVGPERGIKAAAQELGNEPEALSRPNLIPLFVGVALGVLVGSIPIALPGLPAPLQIGIAGGPFIVAIALSQLGSFGPMVWYMPVAGNRMVQDLGLSVFLACVGFQSGGGLFERAAHAGIGLIVAGAVVTIVPVFIVACYARAILRMNFITLSGWVAGTLTSTPALVFANEEAGSESPALAYASVAPVCEILPIVFAELLALVLR